MNTRSAGAFPRVRAFTLVELMVTVAIIGLILAMALPNYLKSRAQARKQICIENLSQIESAKQVWGVQNGKKDGDAATVDDIIGITSYIKVLPVCPGGGTYDFTSIGENATCNQEGHVL